MSQFSLGARVLIVMFVTCGLAQARQLNVRDSFPAAESILDGRNAQYIIRFDGWVDHGASQMDVTENGKMVEPLVPTRDSEPDVLAASAPALPPGRYQLHWHAKSVPDGRRTSEPSIRAPRGSCSSKPDHAFCVSSTNRCHVSPNEPSSSWAPKSVWEPR